MIFKRQRPKARIGLVILAALSSIGTAHAQRLIVNAPSRGLSAQALSQIASLEAEKESRTPIQQKIDSQLIYAAKMSQGQAITNAVPTLQVSTDVVPDVVGRVDVDIDGNITPSLLQQIYLAGGKILSQFPQYNTLRARLPLANVEAVAGSADVRFIRPAAQAELERGTFALQTGPLLPTDRKTLRVQTRAQITQLLARDRARRARLALDVLSGSHTISLLDGFRDVALNGFTLAAYTPVAETDAGSVTSEGDAAHRGPFVRSTYGVDGTGIKVGVLSDSIDNTAGSYAAALASGDVSPVTVLSGQAGTGAGEGLAMLEIVHDLAPGAQLYFATAFGSAASFAQNIRNLRAAGCDIIIDDVGYFNESPFQDDFISQAVADVTASGALYFSSASNSGNLDHKTAGTWEGDFLSGGAAAAPITTGSTKGYILHQFTGTDQLTGAAVSQPYDAFPAVAPTGSSRRGDLFWSDPLGASTNDYDLFYLSADGTTVLHSSTNAQTGTQDPYETFGIADTESPFINKRFVIVKAANALPRFLHFDTGRGFLTIATPGVTRGHSAVPAAFSTAATPAAAAASAGGNGRIDAPTGPYPGSFSTANNVEYFSSDGPRRVFYNVNGTPITPGDLSSTGGFVRPKPDITAADGVTTTLPTTSGLNPFYGTSAAAPHAGAIAALLKSYNPTLTPAQYRTALTGTAIDIAAAGFDRDSGYGIVDAASSLASVPATVLQPLTINPATVSGGMSSTGTVTLVAVAPAGGAIVTLAATAPASVPASVTIPAGQTTATFPIATAVVTTTTTATITATYQSVSRSNILTVSALYSISGTVTTQNGTPVNGVTVTTQVPGVAALPAQTTSTATAIPDGTSLTGQNPGTPVYIPVTFTGSGTVGSIQVGVNITHPYRGDLLLALFAPDGSSYVILKNPSNDSTPNYVTTFPSPTPTDNPLSTLYGQPVAGTWYLYVQDYYSGDTGIVNSFTLTLGQNTLVTAQTATNSLGTYTLSSFSPGSYTLTPSKSGFNFLPASATVTVGPNATQNFILSQAGVRTSATIARNASEYLVTVTFANGGSSIASAILTKATLGTSSPTAPTVPTSLGAIAAGEATSVVLHYPLSAGASGSSALLRVSGSYTGGSFAGTLPITLP